MPQQVFKKGTIFGLTHSLDGEPIMKMPRSVKVGIGLPKGPAIHVYIDGKGKWCVQYTNKEGENKLERFDTKMEAQHCYRQQVKLVPERKYPRKLEYFIFTRIGSDGVFRPDFDLMEAHGSMPTDLDIVFTEDNPLDSQLQMWSASALQCEGDGINARRIVSMAKTEDEKKLAATATASGEKYFPIVEGCRERGCPFARPSEDGKKPAMCKPHSHLRFQLLSSPSLGSEVTFDTTSYRSTAWLFSSIEKLRALAGGHIAGVPVKLRIAPFKVQYDEKKTSTAFAVWVDLSGNDVTEMRQKLIEAVNKFHGLALGPKQLPSAPKQIAEPETIITDIRADADEEDFVSEEERAASLAAEFYPDEQSDSPDHDVVEAVELKKVTPALEPIFELGRTHGMKDLAIMEFCMVRESKEMKPDEILAELKVACELIAANKAKAGKKNQERFSLE